MSGNLSNLAFFEGVGDFKLKFQTEEIVFKIKDNFNRIKSVTKFLCVKTSSGKVVVQLFPHLTVHRHWRER